MDREVIGQRRRWTEAYIGLGSNLKDPAQQLQDAYQALRNASDLELLATSRWYLSAAVGPGEQPDYLNAVVKVKTCLSPMDLLETLQQIEQEQGRERLIRWGARTLDLDILLFGEESIQSEDLIVPHAYLAERNFVVLPLMELCPKAVLPDGRVLSEIATTLTSDGLGEPLTPELSFSLAEK